MSKQNRNLGATQSKAQELRNRLVPKQQILSQTITMNTTFKHRISKTNKTIHLPNTPPIPPLPEAPSSMQQQIPELGEDGSYDEIFSKMKSPFEFIDYARKHNLRKEYIYLVPSGEIETAELPTNLVPISQKDLGLKIPMNDKEKKAAPTSQNGAQQATGKLEFWNLSLEGLTHINGNVVDFTPLDEWLRSIDHFKKLMTIPFFKYQREWRMFLLWKKYVQRGKMHSAQIHLSADLFFANNIIQPAFIQVQRQIYQIQSIKLFSLRSDGNYTLNQFMEENAEYRKKVAKKFEYFYKNLIRIVQDACEATTDSLSSPERQASSSADDGPLNLMIAHYHKTHSKAAALSNADTVQNLAYTQKASHKATCEKLTRFIRLVDYVVISALRSICFNSLLDFYSVMKILYDNGAEQLEFKSENDVSDLNLSPEFTKIYEIIKGRTSEIFNAPIFLIDVKYDNTLQFTPTDYNIIEKIDQVRNEFIDILFKVPRLIVNPIFTPLHTADTEDSVFNPDNIKMPDLGQIIFNDELFKETTTKQNTIIFSAFQMLKFFAQKFQHAIEIYEEDQKFDISFMEEKGCTPSEIRLKIEDIRDQESILKKIVDKNNVGLFCAQTKSMKGLFLTAPGKCLSMIRMHIPVITKRNLTEFDNNIMKAYTALKSEITDVPSFINYIIAVDKYNEEINHIIKHSEMIKSFFSLASDQGTYLSTDQQTEFNELLPYLDEVKNALKASRDKRSDLTPRFAVELDASIADLHERVKVVMEMANDPELFRIETTCKEAARILVLLVAKTDELKDLSDSYNSYQTTMGKRRVKFDDVNELCNLVKHEQLMWETLSEWNVKMSEWFNMNFNEIDIEQFSVDITAFKEKALLAFNYLPKNPVAENLITMIEGFLNLLPVIKNLNNPALKEEHKNSIDALLGGKIFRNHDYSLRTLYELNAFMHVEGIANVAAHASNEQKLLDMLQSVKETIDSMKFVVIQGKNQKSFIGGISEIISLIDDAKATISAVRSSQYVAQLRANADDWMRTLRSFTKTINKIQYCQNLWDFISGILQSGDTIRQIPNSKDVGTIDKIMKGLLTRIADDPSAFRICNLSQTLPDIEQAINILEKMKSSIYQALEAKRMAFPRLYFISDNQFISLISKSKEALSLRPYLPLLFDGIANYEIEVENHIPNVSSVMSADGEVLKLRPVKYKPNVEQWLANIEEIVVRTLRNEMKSVNAKSSEMVHEVWIDECLSQSGFVLSQVHFSDSINLALQAENPDATLANVLNNVQVKLETFTKLMKADLEPLQRKKFSNYIALLCRQQEITETLISVKAHSLDVPEWKQEIRYSFDTDDKGIIVQQGDFVVKYGYEFCGSAPRIPINAEIARCFRYSTVALESKIQVLLNGKSGVSEAIIFNEYARMFGMFFVKFKCSDLFSLSRISMISRGIIQSGVWGCLIDIDHIDFKSLSVITENIIQLRDAQISGIKKITAAGYEIPINPLSEFFYTTFPRSRKSTPLPSNMLDQLRVINLLTFDYKKYIYVKLRMLGIENADVLAKTIDELLSAYSKYSASESLLQIFNKAFQSMQQLSIDNPQMTGEEIAYFAFANYADYCMTPESHAIFRPIINEYFNGTELMVLAPNQELVKCIKYSCEYFGITYNEAFSQWIDSIMNVFRHHTGIIFVGPHDSGKTSILEVLQKINNIISESNRRIREVEIHRFYPNAMSCEDLLGTFSETPHKWKDGQLELDLLKLKDIDKQNWVVFDGVIQANVAENISLAMEHVCFSLPSGTRLVIPDDTKFVFETTTIANSSPSTIAKCAIITFNPNTVDPLELVNAKIQQIILPLLNEQRNHISRFKEICENSIKQIHQYYTEICDSTTVVTFNHCVMSFFELFLLLADGVVFLDENSTENMCMIFVFAFVWGFGGWLDPSHRNTFDAIIRDLFTNTCNIPPKGTVFDWYVVKGEKFKWESWLESIPKFFDTATPEFESCPEGIKVYNVIVPTVETERTTYLLNILVKAKKNVLVSGVSGCGKTLVVNEFLKSIDDDDISKIKLLMSYGMTRQKFEELLLRNLQIKNDDKLYPTCDKHGIVVIDSINSAQVSKFGTNASYEMLREILNCKGFRSTSKGKNLQVDNLSFLGIAMNQKPMIDMDPGITNRMFNITMQPLTAQTEQLIFHSFLTVLYNNEYQDSIKKAVGKLTVMLVETLDSYEKVFPRNPSTPWAMFNLHVIGDILQSMLKSSQRVLKNTQVLERFVTHEIYRIFVDKMSTETEVKKFTDMYEAIIKKKMNSEQPINTLTSVLYGSLNRTTRVVDDEPQIYEEYSSIDEILPIFKDMLDDFRYSRCSNSPDISILKHTAINLTKICRIFRSPKGNALLIGPLGSGKRTLSRLGSFIIDADYIEIEDNFQAIDEVKNHMIRCGVSAKKCVIVFTSEQLKSRRIAEIANILVTGEGFLQLFSSEEIDKICIDLVSYARKSGKPESHPQLLSIFNERLLEHMHIVLSLEDKEAEILRFTTEYSSALRFCTACYIDRWDTEDLNAFGKDILCNVQCFDDQLKKNLLSVSTFVYKTIEAESSIFEKENQIYVLSPFMYNRYINSVIDIYQKFIDKSQNDIDFTKGALDKYNDAKESIENSKKQLSEINSKLDSMEKQKDAASDVIKGDMAKLEEKKKRIQEETDQLNEDTKVAEELLKKIQAEQEQSVPQLRAALAKIKDIKQEQVTSLISEVDSSPVMETISDCICIMNEMKPNQKNFSALVEDRQFFTRTSTVYGEKRRIANNVFRKMDDKIKKCTNFERPAKPEWAALYDFVKSVYEHEIVSQKIQPMHNQYQQVCATIRTRREKIKRKSHKLKKLEDQIEAAKLTFVSNPAEAKKLIGQKTEILARIDRFNTLSDSMKDVIKIWSTKVEKLEEDKVFFPANAALCALYFVYLGSFGGRKREEILKKIISYMTSLNINVSNDFTFEGCFVDKTTINQWLSLGLPADKASTENAIIVKFGPIVPYIVDPDEICSRWITNLESTRQLATLTPQTANYIRSIEVSARGGVPVLITNVGDSLDPFVEALLIKKPSHEGKYTTKVNDRTIEVDSRFALYIVSNRRDSPRTPEMFMKTTVVSFKQNEESFETVAISRIIKSLHSEVIDKLNHICQNIIVSQKQMDQNEGKLVELFTNSGNALIDDEVLFAELKKRKDVFLSDKSKIVELEDQMKELEAKKEEYRKAAETVSSVLAVIYNLSRANKLFVYNIESISSTMLKSLELLSANVYDEGFNLGKELSKSVVFSIANTMSPPYRTLVLILCAFAIGVKEGRFTKEEISVFSRIRTSHPAIENPAPASIRGTMWECLSWISDNVPNVKKFMLSLADDVTPFIEFLNNEEVDIPEKYAQDITTLQKIMILRIFKQESLQIMIDRFLEEEYGKEVHDYKYPSIEDTFTNPEIDKHPLMLLLDKESSEPRNVIYQTAKTCGMAQRFQVITSEQLGMHNIDTLISEFAATGGLLYFPYADYNPSIISSIDLSKLNEKFHVVLSAHECTGLSRIAVHSIKIPFHSPSMKSALLLLASTLDLSILTKTRWTRIMYLIMLIHAGFMTRKYIWSVFSISYDVGMSEWYIILSGVKKLFDQYSNVKNNDEFPLEQLVLLLTDHAYFAPICNPFDRLRTKEIVRSIISPSCLTSKFKLYEIRLPKEKGIDEIMSCIDESDEGVSHISNGRLRLDNIIKEQELSILSKINIYNECKEMDVEVLQYVTVILLDIKKQIPVIDDVGSDDEMTTFSDPLMVVINKEINYLRKKVAFVNASIAHLLQVSQRKIPYTESDKEDITSIASSLRPDDWDFGYSPDELLKWIVSLRRNADFFNNWVRRGKPKIFIAKAFHYVKVFTLAVEKKLAKVMNVPIDDIVIEAKLLFKEPEEVGQNEFIISGIGILGAKWTDNGLVSNDDVVIPIPYVSLVAITKKEAKSDENLFKIPIYSTKKPFSINEYIADDPFNGNTYIRSQQSEFSSLRANGACFVII